MRIVFFSDKSKIENKTVPSTTDFFGLDSTISGLKMSLVQKEQVSRSIATSFD